MHLVVTTQFAFQIAAYLIIVLGDDKPLATICSRAVVNELSGYRLLFFLIDDFAQGGSHIVFLGEHFLGL